MDIRWNTFLLMSSCTLLLVWIGAGFFTAPLAFADVVVQELSEDMELDEEEARRHLQRILLDRSLRHTLVHSLPLGIVVMLILLREIHEHRTRRRASP